MSSLTPRDLVERQNVTIQVRMEKVIELLSPRDKSLFQDKKGQFLAILKWQGLIFDESSNLIGVNWDGLFCEEGMLQYIWIPASVQQFSAYNCKLIGNLPLAEFPRGLKNLMLERNRLSGRIEMDHLPPSIQRVSLRDNKLHGSVDMTLLPKTLQELNLAGNTIEDPIDLSVLPSSLRVLNLGNNLLTKDIRLGPVHEKFDLLIDGNPIDKDAILDTCKYPKARIVEYVHRVLEDENGHRILLLSTGKSEQTSQRGSPTISSSPQISSLAGPVGNGKRRVIHIPSEDINMSETPMDESQKPMSPMLKENECPEKDLPNKTSALKKFSNSTEVKSPTVHSGITFDLTAVEKLRKKMEGRKSKMVHQNPSCGAPSPSDQAVKSVSNESSVTSKTEVSKIKDADSALISQALPPLNQTSCVASHSDSITEGTASKGNRSTSASVDSTPSHWKNVAIAKTEVSQTLTASELSTKETIAPVKRKEPSDEAIPELLPTPQTQSHVISDDTANKKGQLILTDRSLAKRLRGQPGRESLTDQELMERVVAKLKPWDRGIFQYAKGKYLPLNKWKGVKRDKTQNIISIDWENLFTGGGELDFRWLPSTIKTLDAERCELRGGLSLVDFPDGLEYLSLSHNKMSGELNLNHVPPSLGSLFLNENAFCGSLDMNKLPESLRFLELGGNFFEGPLDLRCLNPGLLRLDLGGNKLMKDISFGETSDSPIAVNLTGNPIDEEDLVKNCADRSARIEVSESGHRVLRIGEQEGVKALATLGKIRFG